MQILKIRQAFFVCSDRLQSTVNQSCQFIFLGFLSSINDSAISSYGVPAADCVQRLFIIISDFSHQLFVILSGAKLAVYTVLIVGYIHLQRILIIFLILQMMIPAF